ncbi:MAG: LysM peptidoglycan-binding domain-containing protein [Thermoleophilia bacterium]|nr:LysM peptidoglycan-binding domain-containing protein [Thermoleophilia bacterium]
MDTAAPSKTRKSAKTTGSSGGGSYTVVAGDTLSSIATRHGTTWQKLYATNKAAVGSNPNMIHPGLKLKL